jgi:hypothetical protein
MYRAATKKGKARTILSTGRMLLSPKQQGEKLDAPYMTTSRRSCCEEGSQASPTLLCGLGPTRKGGLWRTKGTMLNSAATSVDGRRVLKAQERQLERDERRNAVNRQRTVARKKMSIVVGCVTVTFVLCQFANIASYTLR